MNPKYPTKFSRVSFDIDQFRGLIQAQGYRVKWEQASLCSCRIEGDGHKIKPTCPVCGGGGWLYTNPTETMAIVTRISYKPDLEKLGLFVDGEAYFSTVPEQILSYRDRITLLDAVMVRQEVQLRSSGTIQGLDYGIVKRSLVIEDKIAITQFSDADYNHVTLRAASHGQNVGDVITITGTTHYNGNFTIVAATTDTITITHSWEGDDATGYITGSQAITTSVRYMIKNDETKKDPEGQTELLEGVDFTVTPDGKIDWSLGDALGTAPAVGVGFTVSYYMHPSYIIVQYPYTIRDTWNYNKVTEKQHAPMPINARGILEFMVE